MDSAVFVSAILRRPDPLKEVFRAERFKGGDPFMPAAAALMLLAGGEVEPRPFQVLSEGEKEAAHQALKTSRHWVARGMLEHRPELEHEVIGHPAFRKKVDRGPLGRMPKWARAVRLVSKLLLDPHEAAALEKRGYFDWDDGTCRSALVIDYAWRQATGRKAWMTEKPRQTRAASRAFARKLFREDASNPRVQLIDARLMQAWYCPDEKRMLHDQKLLSDLAASGADEGVRFTAAQGLFDLGIRASRTDVVSESVDRIEKLVPAAKLNDPGLRVMRAWSLFLQDRKKDALDMTLGIARSRSPAARASVIPLLKRLGEEKRAKDLSRHL